MNTGVRLKTAPGFRFGCISLLAGWLAAAPVVAAGIRSDSGVAAQSAAIEKAANGIDWFTGSLEAAFQLAGKTGKPLLLYWGASWCPPCNEIKAHVFVQQDFIERSRQFVMVHFDADEPVAQKWGRTFRVKGYPTLLALNPHRVELARISGGLAVSRYKEFLAAALDAARPIQVILADMQRSARLSLTDCQRLAFTDWQLRSQDRAAHRSADLQRAAARCPAGAQQEKARLIALATDQALFDERVALGAGKAPSVHLMQLLRDEYAFLGDAALVRGMPDILDPNELYIAAMQSAKLADMTAVRSRWIDILAARAADTALDDSTRLSAVERRLDLLRQRDGAISATGSQAAVSFTDSVLLKNTSSEARMYLVGSALGIFRELGMPERGRALLEAEVKSSSQPLRYMQLLAKYEEEQRNSAKALQWSERAFHEAPDATAKFDTGVGYIDQLVRLRPEEVAAIRDATLTALAALEGPARIGGHTAVRLTKLDAALRAWNAAGNHPETIAQIRQRMDGICAKLPSGDPGRRACASFLAPSAPL